jgi:hypothetical protein
VVGGSNPSGRANLHATGVQNSGLCPEFSGKRASLGRVDPAFLLVLAIIGACLVGIALLALRPLQHDYSDARYLDASDPVGIESPDPASCTIVRQPDGARFCPVSCGCGPLLYQVRRFITDSQVCDSVYTDAAHFKRSGISCYDKGTEPKEPTP